MDDMTTKELAQWLETIARQIASQHESGKQLALIGFAEVEKPLITEAAARLRGLAEDAERLDWLEKAEMPVFRIDNGSRSDGVSLMPGWVCGSGFGVQSSQRTIRQAIDEARKM